MFSRLDVIEKAGTGITRIKRAMKAEGLPSPKFEDMGKFFKITLLRPEGVDQKTTQKTTQKIIELLKTNPSLSRQEIADALGNITADGVKYQLTQMQKKGLIKRVGPDKGGHWETCEGNE